MKRLTLLLVLVLPLVTGCDAALDARAVTSCTEAVESAARSDDPEWLKAAVFAACLEEQHGFTCGGEAGIERCTGPGSGTVLTVENPYL
jgi:hypothetical protein